ncbi:sensor histidine kinase [Maribacter sp. 2307ULW6-5]|uniref:sensor histidine kinase n=1 Tax=Maribacter sp. 2307ULW6-5 TaxID=3386275 RepID=UPI0039BD71DA
MSFTHVKQSSIIKIALLLSILVSIPKTVFLYESGSTDQLEFTGLYVADLAYRFVFFLVFSWCVLQLNANVGYAKYAWSTPVRMGVMMLINIAVLIGTLSLFEFLYPHVVRSQMNAQDKGFLAFTYLILLLSLFFIGRILRLQVDRQENRVENEHLKQQSLQNELMALKNQIDPHFLFNSLNSLTSLIRGNEKATQFVKKLSYMYRYILQSGESDLVSVKDELKFLESYTYLILTRYRDRFSIAIDIEEAYMDLEIPPLALQLLVENSVKHNEISGTHPLKVHIFSKDGALFVENEMRLRKTFAEGTKNGLQNLKKRYVLLLRKELTVSTENNIFSVKLPLIRTR